MQFTLRGLKNKTEYEKLYALYSKAFIKTPLNYFKTRIENDPYLNPEDIRIAEENKEFISSIAVLRRKMNWGNKTVNFTGIGNVSTLPEKRGNNLATFVMKDALSHSRALAPHSVILFTGINSFYERFGFFTIPACHIVFKAIKTNRSNYLVRNFNLSDLQSVSGLYNSFNKNLYGTLERKAIYWKSNLAFAEPGEIFLLAENSHTHAIESYIRLVKGSPRNEIWEFAFSAREAFDALLLTACEICNKDIIKSASLHPNVMLNDSDIVKIDYEPCSLAMAYTDITADIPGLKQSFNNYSFWWTDNF